MSKTNQTVRVLELIKRFNNGEKISNEKFDELKKKATETLSKFKKDDQA